MNASLGFGLIGMGLFLAISGCAATAGRIERQPTIHVADLASPSAGQSLDAKRVALQIAAYADGRRAAPSRRIGDIHSTVVDMHRSELVLDQDISIVVTRAISAALAARGFEVSNLSEGADPRGADVFQVSGNVRKFALDIAGRDLLAIAVDSTVRGGNGSVLWSGEVSEIADRYAGVSGNTRSSIAEYLGAGLKTVADKTAVQVNDAARRARPDLFGQSLPAPGLVQRADAPAPVSVPSQAPGHTSAAPATPGRLSVVTTPPRAKVYLGDVYWGLSPLDLELAPDIYALRVVLDGYKTTTEKVSVRRAALTEVEIRLER